MKPSFFENKYNKPEVKLKTKTEKSSTIKDKLEEHLLEIEKKLNHLSTSREESALLQIAKSNALIGLQKYE